MPLKPPFHKQETRYSCVPACLRMVLGSFGVDLSESALRVHCDCMPYGTDALMAVDAARALAWIPTMPQRPNILLTLCLVLLGFSPTMC